MNLEKKYNSIVEWFKKYYTILIPYFLGPLAFIYLIDYIIALLGVVKWLSVGLIMISVISLLVGFFIELSVWAYGDDKYQPFFGTNIAKKLPLIFIGRDIARWGLKDDDAS